MQIFSGYAAETAAWGNGESFCFTEYNFTAMRVEIQQPVRIKRRQDEYIGLCGKISATVEIRTVQPAVLGQTWRAAFASVCFCRRNRSLHGADGRTDAWECDLVLSAGVFESVSVFCGDWDDRYGVDGRGTENHAGRFSGKPYVGAAGAGKAG